VTSATFRLPGPLAVAVATVDRMSGGRVELGIGAGWYDTEHTAYGIPFPTTKERFDRLEEQLEIITGLWRTPVGESYSFAGAHYSVQDSPALPKPHDELPRIIIGGFGAKRTPRLAARFANEFNVPFAGVDDARRLFDNVRTVCADLGRDEPVSSAAQVVCCGADEADVARRASQIGRGVDELRQNGLAGTPNELIDKIGRFAEIGCTRIHLQLLDLEDLDHIELIARDVMPHV
jgi:alkanesulfonate monooxygenase SsuD/methylene tetrahydromethanopterin reductase-like flavin-dependent oxidoreductase (luciferase family)